MHFGGYTLAIITCFLGAENSCEFSSGSPQEQWPTFKIYGQDYAQLLGNRKYKDYVNGRC